MKKRIYDLIKKFFFFFSGRKKKHKQKKPKRGSYPLKEAFLEEREANEGSLDHGTPLTVRYCCSSLVSFGVDNAKKTVLPSPCMHTWACRECYFHIY